MRYTEHDSSSSVSPDLPPEPGPSKPTNGHTSNGVSGPSATNGSLKHATKSSPSRVSLPGTTLYEDSNIDREEFIRLVIQSLRDVGYTESATTLEAESGYVMETPDVAQFRTCIVDGRWATAEKALTALGVTEEEGLLDAKFLISQQKYLEYLEAGNTTAALHVLRNEIAPIQSNPEHLLPLSSLLMCTDAADLRQRAVWDGASGSSRRRLLVNLQQYIPSSIMIPPRRFSTLLDQSRSHQISRCLYHNAPPSSRNFSLYSDHRCDKDMFPRDTVAILQVHSDEVWTMEWSHSGKLLASASKDQTVIIWAIGSEPDPSSRTYTHQLTLRDHPFPVGCLAWSLDDSIVLSSAEQYIKMWNTKTGICIRTLDAHTETVSALAWVPDGSGFLSGSQDRKIILWGSDGRQRDSWGITSIRVTDLAVTPDFTRLVAVGVSATGSLAGNATLSGRGDSTTPPGAGGRTSSNGSGAQVGEHQMIVYDLATKQPEVSVSLVGQLTSVKISDDSQYALINHAPDEIHLWDISTGRMARKYTGQRQGRHIIRSCFGGVDGNFVVSGSEDGNVYVWHRERGILLDILQGHGPGSVNSVAWNPRNKRMFASCSDDCTIRIWEALPQDHTHTGASSSSVLNTRLLEHEGTGGGSSSADHSGKGKGKRREPWDED